jgi:hypothetical protein
MSLGLPYEQHYDFSRSPKGIQSGSSKRPNSNDPIAINEFHMLQVRKSFESGMKIGEMHLSQWDRYYLGVCLNHSVFLWENEKNHSAAHKVAQATFNAAIECLDDVPVCEYEDSTLLLQLIRDNLTIWLSDDEDLEPDDEDIQLLRGSTCSAS